VGYTDIITNLEDFSRVRQGFDAVKNQLSHSGSIMMMLGPFMFAVDTAPYQQLRRQTEYRWANQERFGRQPALQYTGPGAERITLDGLIFPEFAGGLHQVQAMRELAGIGKAMPLVDGLGVIYGQWAIVRLEETLRVLFDNGQPRKIGFNIELERYGEDQRKGLLEKLKGLAGGSQ